MGKTKETAILVNTWNDKKFLKGCFDNLQSQTYKDFEIIMIDNNSSDGSVEYVKKNFPKIKIFALQENLGYTGGNNKGIEYSINNNFKYTFIMNNDAELEKDCLEKLINIMKSKDKIGIVVPEIYEYDEHKDKIYLRGGIMNLKMGAPKAVTINKEKDIYDVDTVSGCVLLVNNEVYKKTSAFYTGFFMYWDDPDFSLRVKRAGFENKYFTGTQVYHLGSGSTKNTNFPKTYYLVRNRFIMIKMHAKFLDRMIFYFYFLIKFPYFILSKKNDREIYLSLLGIYHYLIKKEGKLLE
ncbi:MAG: glycosyltransferase family 2 protein [Nanoarchaeota archaeon]